MSVRFGLLGLLAQQPRHGYELHSALVALLGGQGYWEVKVPQVYSTLARLEESGLVAAVGTKQEGGPEKRILTLTAAGWAELKAWLASPSIGEHLHDEMFAKLTLCLELGADLEPLTKAQRAALYREWHRLTALRQASSAERDLAQILLLEKTMMHLEAELRWLDMVEARLDEIRWQPRRRPVRRPRGRPRRRGERAG